MRIADSELFALRKDYPVKQFLSIYYYFKTKKDSKIHL